MLFFFCKQTAVLHMAWQKTIPEIPGMGCSDSENFHPWKLFVWLYIGSNLLDLRTESQEEKAIYAWPWHYVLNFRGYFGSNIPWCCPLLNDLSDMNWFLCPWRNKCFSLKEGGERILLLLLLCVRWQSMPQSSQNNSKRQTWSYLTDKKKGALVNILVCEKTAWQRKKIGKPPWWFNLGWQCSCLGSGLNLEVPAWSNNHSEVRIQCWWHHDTIPAHPRA